MACGTDPVSIIPPVVKPNLNLKNNVDVDKSVHYPQTMVSWSSLCRFQTGLIRCDGVFNVFESFPLGTHLSSPLVAI
jgi:hypothetical protein